MTTKDFINKLVNDYIRDQFRFCGRILNEHAARAEILCAAKIHFCDPGTKNWTLNVPKDANGLAHPNPVIFDAYGFEPKIHDGLWMIKVYDRYDNILGSALVDSDVGYAVMD